MIRLAVSWSATPAFSMAFQPAYAAMPPYCEVALPPASPGLTGLPGSSFCASKMMFDAGNGMASHHLQERAVRRWHERGCAPELRQACYNQRQRTPRQRSVHTTVSYVLSSGSSCREWKTSWGKNEAMRRESIAAVSGRQRYVFLTKRSGARSWRPLCCAGGRRSNQCFSESRQRFCLQSWSPPPDLRWSRRRRLPTPLSRP